MAWAHNLAVVLYVELASLVGAGGAKSLEDTVFRLRYDNGNAAFGKFRRFADGYLRNCRNIGGGLWPGSTVTAASTTTTAGTFGTGA